MATKIDTRSMNKAIDSLEQYIAALKLKIRALDAPESSESQDAARLELIYMQQQAITAWTLLRDVVKWIG